MRIVSVVGQPFMPEPQTNELFVSLMISAQDGLCRKPGGV